MRSPALLAAALLVLLACRSRLPVDRPSETSAPAAGAATEPAPVAPRVEGQVEYYQISEG